jgi:hypothetical protein
VEHCPSDSWEAEIGWFFSPSRMTIDLGSTWSDSDQFICSRCESLDLVRFFETRPPWNAQSDFTENFDEQKDFTRSLGKTGSVQFWTNCALCCCFIAITPHPSSVEQEIFLVPDWTISRVSGELGAVTMDSPEKRQYATCLIPVLKPSSLSLGTRVVAHRGDALCMLEEGSEQQTTLGGRQIDSHNIDVDLINRWIAACVERHDEFCLPTATKELHEIRLIEIESRKVVAYPGPRMRVCRVELRMGRCNPRQLQARR